MTPAVSVYSVKTPALCNHMTLRCVITHHLCNYKAELRKYLFGFHKSCICVSGSQSEIKGCLCSCYLTPNLAPVRSPPTQTKQAPPPWLPPLPPSPCCVWRGGNCFRQPLRSRSGNRLAAAGGRLALDLGINEVARGRQGPEERDAPELMTASVPRGRSIREPFEA